MIPTISDIVDGLLSGKISREQAIKWLEAHAERDDDGLRDHFAGQALPWCLQEFGGNAEDMEQPERAAYQIADAMIAARTGGKE